MNKLNLSGIADDIKSPDMFRYNFVLQYLRNTCITPPPEFKPVEIQYKQDSLQHDR